MPNARSPKKSMVGGYMARQLAAQFKAAAKRHNTTAKDLLERLIKDYITKENGENNDAK